MGYAGIPMRRREDGPARRRLRKGIYIVPSLFTTFNIALGFYAIWHTFHGSTARPWQFDNAAKAIGFAFIFDALDGLTARLTGTSSDFGRELDSLADVITFGVAPAFLAWIWGFQTIGNLNGDTWPDRLVQLGAIASFLFLVAGASRLARFNIQANPQPSNPGRPGRRYFVGMPIPAAAGVIAASVHFAGGSPLTTWWLALIWLIFLLAIGFLMVSTWRFYSFKGIDLHSRRSFRLLPLLAGLVAAIWYFSQYVLFILALGYMLAGVLVRFMYVVRRRGGGAPPPPYKEASELR
jgi:CDP-diacylglycerol--serine O-phosphatidyltransferase